MPAARAAKRKAPAPSAAAALRGSKRFRSSVSTSPERVLSKASSSTDPLRQPHPFWQQSEEAGVVLRKYYPHEMSNARAKAYQEGKLPRPMELLNDALDETFQQRQEIKVKGAVVHWFKNDLRTADNRALRAASEAASKAGVPLVTMYLVSPEDFEAHLTSPVRVDFTIRNLKVLKEELAKLDIPLYVETVEKRKDIPGRIQELLEEWDASHLYTNMEYEVDELRREAKLVRALAEKDISMDVMHDTVVVPPGTLTTGAGNQYAVYTPWYRAWVAHVHAHPHLLELFDPPAKNHVSARTKFKDLFASRVPDAPANKRITKDEAERFRALWPAGEHEAAKRLEMFCEEKVGKYTAARNLPAETGTSSLSAHFSAGTLSTRTAIRMARDRNKTKKLNAGNESIQRWISEIAWRDFYKHVLARWPYVCMNKPFKPEYANISWSYDAAHFAAWCEGRTGFPIVDAAMRQLNHVGWMHNRCRMIVASFLAKDLLIDWRMGEKYFMGHLIDGDFASNNGGWGFAASVGVDPQPYFRIFNPLLQSEKFDPDGEYIRKWVPELKGVKGDAVHEPYGRGAGPEAKKKGYPEPIVEHKGARERALAAYKKGISSDL
ncbi:uncharacterized protein E0L32_003974 [Thyridium curvatum]|uniref:Photolyase/cryptochrome alpha/beta domain-containing protein n=1 Tax=Thyridium curvatum TaxID=1093900 RepID=A0A507AZQ6_9PEZI|nr:uncharacterized protein E0L32_003974 [Thyridium curvatum]TPX16325.1 hypothetical protein E0L32_003974 [Thyridium curvatum]